MATAVMVAVEPDDPGKRTVTLLADCATTVPLLTDQVVAVQGPSVKLAVDPPRTVSAPERRQAKPVDWEGA